MPADIQFRTLTTEEVFQELMQCVDISDAYYGLTLDSTVDDFNRSSGELDCADMLREGFGIEPTVEWWEKWKPHDAVRMLCENIARMVEVPVSRRVTLFGKPCHTAGHFTMMKQLLAEAGADVETLAPSTPIAPYLKRHANLFCRMRLSQPGRLPAPDSSFHPFIVATAFLLGTATGVASLFSDAGGCGALVFGIAIFLVILQVSARFRSMAWRLRFPGIVTFCDFVRAAFDLPPKKVRR